MARVSIVVAAYGRSNVLVHALDRVRAQTEQDWEVIVVDDASPDDTSEVVVRYGDPRVRVVRLTQNVGEQSVPNNVGVALASAPLIAFLNQDDLWFPDHLSHLLELQEETGARLVWSMLAFDLESMPHQPDPYRPTWLLRGWRSQFDVRTDAPASSWLLERSLHLELGGWRPAADFYGPTSQDFLFRAWRAGAAIVASGRLSVLAEGAGQRPGSYAERQDSWQRSVLPQLEADPDGLRKALTLAARPLDVGPRWRGQGPRSAVWAFGQWARAELLARVGISPYDLTYREPGRARGAYLERLRTTRGLPATPR